MSSSSDPSLSLGSGSGTDTLSGIVNFIQGGGSPITVITASLLGVITSPFVAFADIVRAVTTFFTTPLTAAATAVGDLQVGLISGPIDVLEAGAAVTSAAIIGLGEGLVGLFGLPISVGLVMLSLFLVVQYLQEDETGDTLPGLPIDIPTDILGVEEEDPDADS